MIDRLRYVIEKAVYRFGRRLRRARTRVFGIKAQPTPHIMSGRMLAEHMKAIQQYPRYQDIPE